MVDRMQEPLSYYCYKKRTGEIQKMINYSSILERFRNHAPKRINKSLAIPVLENEDQNEAKPSIRRVEPIQKTPAESKSKRSVSMTENRRQYKRAGDIIKDAKKENQKSENENNITITNVWRQRKNSIKTEEKNKPKIVRLRLKKMF